MKVLVIEDNQTVAEAVKETLEIQGWQIEICSDGKVALEKVEGHVHYDLLLTDYDLPFVNGLELVRRVRRLAHRYCTPVIVLSAMPVGWAAREAGADVFLQKPQDIGLLVETITRLVREREQEGLKY